MVGILYGLNICVINLFLIFLSVGHCEFIKEIKKGLIMWKIIKVKGMITDFKLRVIISPLNS